MRKYCIIKGPSKTYQTTVSDNDVKSVCQLDCLFMVSLLHNVSFVAFFSLRSDEGYKKTPDRVKKIDIQGSQDSCTFHFDDYQGAHNDGILLHFQGPYTTGYI
jgi:hypothetical protein